MEMSLSDNWNQLKSFSRSELEDLVPSDFKFKTEPWTHQIASFVACILNDGFMLSLDMGTGKTKIAIDTCTYQLKRKILVVCLDSAIEKWAEEVHAHSNSRATCLKGTRDERWDKINGDGYFIINYEGLRSMLTAKSTGRKKGLVSDGECVKRLLAFGWDAIIIDESHKAKSVESTNFDLLANICRAIHKRMLLTGTPFGNTLEDLWAQYYMIDFGKTFLPNIQAFRAAYFTPSIKQIYRAGRHVVTLTKWVPTETGRAFIENEMYKKAIRYEESEVDELPKKVFRTLQFNLSSEQRSLYTKLIQSLKGEQETIINRTMTFRQLCSGFVLKLDKEFKLNPKLVVLRDLIESVVDNHKIVVFHEFTKESEHICKMLRTMKIGYAELNGQVKDKHAQQKKFENDPDIRVMVAHPKSGGESIDLIAATYCIFYSNGHSVIQRKQCLKRIHRGGQTQRCFFYDILGKGTVEVKIKEQLDAGVDVFSSIVDEKSLLEFVGHAIS